MAKDRIDLKKPIIMRFIVGIEQHLDHAKTLIHQGEQGAVTFFTDAQFLFDMLALGNIGHAAHQPGRIRLTLGLDHLGVNGHPTQCAIGTDKAEIFHQRQMAVQKQPHAGLDTFAILGVY